MRIDQVMRLLQFGDSMFPVGGFSFSNGLESAIAKGLVHDLETLGSFVRTAADQAAASDGIALLEAHRAGMAGDLDRLLRADRAVHNRKLNAEIRVMTVRMGRKLAELAHRIRPSSLLSEWLSAVQTNATPGTFPVGLGLVLAGLGAIEEEAFAIHQYGVATMVLGAALRLMKVTHLETQALLFELTATAADEYQGIARATLEDMASFAPLMDILAACHVKSHVRLFMS
jgi:urease accessory protein